MTLKLVLTGHQLKKYDWWMSLPSKLSLPEIGFPVMWLLQFADMLWQEMHCLILMQKVTWLLFIWKTINSRLLKRVKKVGRMVNGGHLPIGYRMRCLLTQMVVRLFPECNIRRRKDIRWPSNTAGIRSNMLTVRCTNKLNYVRGRTDWKWRMPIRKYSTEILWQHLL